MGRKRHYKGKFNTNRIRKRMRHLLMVRWHGPSEPITEVNIKIKEEKVDCEKSDIINLSEPTTEVKIEIKEEKVDCEKSDIINLSEPTTEVKIEIKEEKINM
ncbi:unnamed protein product, partial [Meganyctiphanes norvegica]